MATIDSHRIYNAAAKLVRQCETRNPKRIAADLGVKVIYRHDFAELLGMYTYRWRHRFIFLNGRLDEYMEQMVIAHELGHDAFHRKLAGDGLKEFILFSMKDDTEYTANAFAAHVLLPDDDVLECARAGDDVVQIAQKLGSDINLLLIKLQELNKLGCNLNVPWAPDSKFFQKHSQKPE